MERNCSLLYRYVCLTDDPSKVPEGIEARELKPKFRQGCLPKLSVYFEEWAGPVLLFDLDNIIVGSIDDMASFSGDFCVRARLPEYDRGRTIPDGDMIFFTPEGAEKMRNYIEAKPEEVHATMGRERFVINNAYPDCDVWQDALPGQVISYKHHARNGNLPEGARVVSCHGRPRPHELDFPFVKEHWR